METKSKSKIQKFDELQEDLVFLMLQAGLPEGYSVVTASTIEHAVVRHGQPRKQIIMTYLEEKTDRKWTQTYNYKKILRTVDKGLAVEAQRN